MSLNKQILNSNKVYDVIIVGAGPAGSSAATFLGKHGISSLILDKENFPRDKVCGDGLTPQALYWIDRLGCINEVLESTRSCIKEGDLYVNGEYLLTARFPENSKYPDFSILLDRKRLDNILLQNAIKHGAIFQSKCRVTGVYVDTDAVTLEIIENASKKISLKAKVVIGADGVSSVISRSLGNSLNAGVTAVSVRAYYQNVSHDRSQIKVYFDEQYFPGYGWLFVNDDGFANIGIGYAYDMNFPVHISLRDTFSRFIATDLKHYLRDASQYGKLSGGSAAFYKPRSIVRDRVVLVGDSANQGDPLNGSGIHKAMESAFAASQAIVNAFNIGNFSMSTLSFYQHLWEKEYELDRRTGELFLTFAKNPALKDFCLFLLKNIGRLAKKDNEFFNFCTGVFSGVIAENTAVSPLAVISALPRDLSSWFYLIQEYNRESPIFPISLASNVLAGTFEITKRMALNPLQNLGWSMELLTKSIRLVDYQINSHFG
jgi:geranylgeranyl reductase family protein